MRLSALLSFSALVTLTFGTTSCGVNTAGTILGGTSEIRGNVHGGQQPIIGATIQLWAAGTTDTSGNVTPPKSLLQGLVTTDSQGSFNITNDYTCPSSNSQIYITARGGNAGGGNNPQIAMMSLLGSCGALTSSTFISLNEVTTIIATALVAGSIDGSFDANSNITGTQLDNGVTLAEIFSLALSTWIQPRAPSLDLRYLPETH